LLGSSTYLDMSVNQGVTEALDSLLAGLDSLRAERAAADLRGTEMLPVVTSVASLAPRQAAPAPRSSPGQSQSMQSRAAPRRPDALDAPRLIAALAAAAHLPETQLDLRRSGLNLLKRLFRQRAVSIPRIHDSAPGLRVSPRTAALLAKLPPGHVCAVEHQAQEVLYLQPRSTEIDSAEALVSVVAAAAPVGAVARTGPCTDEMVSVRLPKWPEFCRCNAHELGGVVLADDESALPAVAVWLDECFESAPGLLGSAWLDGQTPRPLYSKQSQEPLPIESPSDEAQAVEAQDGP